MWPGLSRGLLTGRVSLPVAASRCDCEDRYSQKGAIMRASVGDRLVVRGTHVDEPVKDGVILEVRHPDGSPPYLVRWSTDGHEGLVFPGPDAYVEHLGATEEEATT